MSKYWDKSITLVEGCTPVSEGCLYCWSETTYSRFHGDDELCRNGKWTGKIRTREDRLHELLKGRKPRVIQVWNDLMHKDVSDSFIGEVFYNAMESQHTILILTKRAKRLSILSEPGIYIPDNLWIGVTTENQRTADERIPYLLQVPGKRWLSVEPLLEEIDFSEYLFIDTEKYPDGNEKYIGKQIHQVIVGCETGRNARPCKIEYIESIVQQCEWAGIPCFVKAVNINGKITSDINKFPESLRVRHLAWGMTGEAS